MAAERLAMRQIREILRQKLLMQRSNRDAARSLGISNGKVSETASRARELGLTWEEIAKLSDDALDVRLFGGRPSNSDGRPRCPWPPQTDPPWPPRIDPPPGRAGALGHEKLTHPLRWVGQSTRRGALAEGWSPWSLSASSATRC